MNFRRRCVTLLLLALTPTLVAAQTAPDANTPLMLTKTEIVAPTAPSSASPDVVDETAQAQTPQTTPAPRPERHFHPIRDIAIVVGATFVFALIVGISLRHS